MKNTNSSPASAEANGKLLPILTYPSTSAPPTEEGGWSLAPILDVVRRRAIVIVGVASVVSGISWYQSFTRQPTYSSAFQLLVEPITDNQALPRLTGAANPSGLDYRSQIQILRSPKILEPISQKIQAQYPGFNYGVLVSGLTVTQPPQSKLIEVSYQDSDAQRVKFVLDKVAEGYLRYSQQERQSNLRQGVEFVNDQLKTTQNRVDVLQRQLQAFRQQNTIVDPQTKSGQVDSQLTALEQQRLEVSNQLAEVQQAYNSLADQSGARVALSQAQSYQQFLSELQALERRIAIEQARFRGDNPTLNALQKQRDRLLPLLRQEAGRVLGDRLSAIESQMAILRVRLSAIDNATQYWQQQAQQLPITSRQFTDLQRELTVATESLNRLLQMREMFQAEVAQKTVSWQLITPPGSPQVPLTSTPQNLLVGALTGLLAAAAVAFLLEKLDNTFRSSSDLKRQAKLPLLGAIPHYPSLYESSGWSAMLNRSNAANSSMQFLFSEAFRSLNTTIRHLNAKSPRKSIVISSAQSGDGKSTISLFLAQAAAAMGQRVLLVDADLRSPQISTLLDLPNQIGLSDLLLDNFDFNSVINPITPQAQDGSALMRIAGRGGLFVLPSGPIPDEPTELLSSQKMQVLMEDLQAAFDLVIYDTPPVLNLADSSLLASQAGGLILVATLRKTIRSAVMDAIENLETAHIPILGIVANGTRGQAYGISQGYTERPVATSEIEN
ncbi:MAG: polysaccharide biosynthesis tyrosine autokinase [Leptolyngbya sp. UWPOB_LEPTO1]|uniref:GumC family protein n=1 Tax=Leptolyngbya sp. UWPOB_LEPTO1 TaxID=2815653 RepID=UPI001AC467D4|nr:polysaccharide biosynthesis tyrosine autokinase [Leptolyngbya sp. UWPOB_LEPTO1]MBN8559294.1 polysaccharide biosynthesis tyrosine autokinase [Leptolyngbya sp. UWPOB_LEPTO1]